MTEFIAVAQAHRLRYPLMQPVDFGKLAFQSEFGAEHLLADEQAVWRRIREEWETSPMGAPTLNPEPLGNGLCRFHLTRESFSPEAVTLLTRLFILAAAEHKGTAEGLDARLAALEGLPVDGIRAWLAAYRAQGCPPVHHSEAYRLAYQPHYRVLTEARAKLLLPL